MKRGKVLSELLAAIRGKMASEADLEARARLAGAFIDALAGEFGLCIVLFGHFGDGNIHTNLMVDPGDAAEMARVDVVLDRIFRRVVEVGGTISGEHGIGLSKKPFMRYQFSPVEMELFRRIKGVFDPDNLLNPGKAVPELHRCAEWGAMHVHGGQLPHPELPRF